MIYENLLYIGRLFLKENSSTLLISREKEIKHEYNLLLADLTTFWNTNTFDTMQSNSTKRFHSSEENA